MGEASQDIDKVFGREAERQTVTTTVDENLLMKQTTGADMTSNGGAR